MSTSCLFLFICNTCFHSGMIKNNTLWKYRVTLIDWSDVVSWLLSQCCWVTACKRCFFLPVLFSSAVLQVWRTVCSSGLGYLISIYHFHNSHHTVEVGLMFFLLFFSVSACSSDLLSLQRDSVNISVALCIVKMLTLKSTNQLRLTPSTNYIRLITMQCSAVRPWVLSSMWLFLRKVSTT